jgi:lipoprotein signal peptidase
LRPTIRLILAIAVVICGIFVLVKSSGDQVAVATGLGLILAGIEGVAP